MSVPEGKMRLQLEYSEISELSRALTVALSDYPYVGEAASNRLRPILRKLNLYLEAIDGPTPHKVRPHTPPEAGVG